MLIIVWLKATGCLYHGCSLLSISAYHIVEVIHVRSYLVFVDAVSDECYVASMDIGNGLDVNGINYIYICIRSDSAPESSLDMKACHDGVVLVRVSSRWYGFEHVGHKRSAKVVESFGKLGVVSMYEG